jgi:hypothetical protein
MDQDIGSEAPGDPAALAFEALRREVALLNVAVAGLAAERASTPDYSETLAEISKGVSVAVASVGKLATSPALAVTPAELTQKITAASDEAGRQDRAALRRAEEMLQRATSDLESWVDTARRVSLQNWRLLQAALAGVVGGAILGATCPIIVAQAAPEQWSWPEKRAARGLHRDMWSAGERMLAVADPDRWREIQMARRIVGQNRDALARCMAAQKGKMAKRCLISMDSLDAS